MMLPMFQIPDSPESDASRQVTTETAEQELPTAIIKSLTMRMNEIGAAITLQEAKVEELKQERQDIADFLATHK